MIRSIAVIGSGGMLGRPVAKELAAAGFIVGELSRNAVRPDLRADVFDLDSLRKAFAGRDAVYMNLAVRHDARRGDRHAETDGLKNVITAARETGVKRLAMISSLVMNYQGMNGFNWWVFDVKKEAVRLLKESGIPSIVFYPSSFMENLAQQRKGTKLMLAGKSKHPMWFVAGSDYGKQVARSFGLEGDVNREYPVQGLEPYTYDAAARVFVQNYPHATLQISTAPLIMLKAMSLWSRPIGYAAKIIEALDNYPEKFQSERTWQELGKPTVTLAEYAKSQPA
jgi:uncharacterized protein YbjT (DUF2867 family)